MREVKPRVQPAVLQPSARVRTFEEVVPGYTREQALEEAARCILCKNARCQAACPLGNRIPEWMRELQQQRVDAAYRILQTTSPMPELCSRLCPQERLCEGSCALGIKHDPVAVGLLERFVAETALGDATPFTRNQAPGGRKRVAAVGSGPASLALSQSLALEGHEVSVFERWPLLGGVLRWIPRFKLPVDLLEHRLAFLRGLGVRFYPNTDVRWVESLVNDEGFDAAFIGIGASRPATPAIPGVSLRGIISSTELLVRVFYEPAELPNDWESITDLIGQRVVVLGGGDSAMDCVRTAIRLRAAQVTCVYRRDEANMPGSRKEVKAAKDEGVDFAFLASPVAFHSMDGHHVCALECVRMELGPPDASGRRAPQPKAGSNVRIDADLVVLAFGYEVEAAFDDDHLYLMAPPRGTVRAQPATGATPIRGVFAGGDCVTGPNLVSTAARAGLIAAQGMRRYFAGESWDALTASADAPSPAT